MLPILQSAQKRTFTSSDRTSTDAGVLQPQMLQEYSSLLNELCFTVLHRVSIDRKIHRLSHERIERFV